MTEAEIDDIMDQIGTQRVANNKLFMQMWRLVFRVAPKEAADIQRRIREGDMKISELNGRLCE